MNTETILLKRTEILSRLSLAKCIPAMEEAFKMHAEGQALTPSLMHFEADDGEFHVKGGGLRLKGTWVTLKAGGCFFQNRERFGLPNILGLILLFDGTNGRPLAIMDSADITALRTGATTALAAKHLAKAHSAIVTICGCGRQGAVQLDALLEVRPSIRRVYAWDQSREAALAFKSGRKSSLEVIPVTDLSEAVPYSDIVVTCTPAKEWFLPRDLVRPGTFISAVGADSPDKQELEPALVASAKLVVDVLEQCANVGELHHALKNNLTTRDQVHAQLGEVVAGRKCGRLDDQEIIVFDTTGSALQDAAAALVVYREAQASGIGLHWDPTR
jgi:ornithine cyclodeaminase/alanine dehydrogenase